MGDWVTKLSGIVAIRNSKLSVVAETLVTHLLRDKVHRSAL